jgi:hypothetical protein
MKMEEVVEGRKEKVKSIKIRGRNRGDNKGSKLKRRR